MRFFETLNVQHIFLYLLPALIFVLLLGLALSYAHFKTRRSEEGQKEVFYEFPKAIEERYKPFPLVLILIIVGTILWVFFYILAVGLLEVKI